MTRKLLTGATVIDGTKAAPRPHAAVLIEDDRILGVGPASDFESNGAEVIDLKGLTVLPGLVSAHEHLSIRGFRGLYYSQHRTDQRLQSLRMAQAAWGLLSEGVTTARDCGAHESINLLMRDAVAQGIAAGPRIAASGRNIIPTYDAPGVEPTGMTVEATTGDDVERLARQLLADGVDFIKVKAFRFSFTGHGQRNFSAADMKRAFDVAHAAGKRAACHTYTAQEVHDALAAGADDIEHALHANGDLSVVDEMLERNAHFIPCHVSWATSAKSTPERRAGHALVIRTAIAKGVKVAAGCDLYTPHLVDEMEALSALGLGNTLAIAAATRRAAKIAGLKDSVGRLEPGLFADLLAVQGDPIRDLGVLRHPVLVMQGGRAVAGTARYSAGQ